MSSELYHEKEYTNISGVAKLIVLLELITVLERRERHIANGKIRIGFDNRKNNWNIISSIKKGNIHTQEAGREIAIIKKMIGKIQFAVEIKLTKGDEKEIEIHV